MSESTTTRLGVFREFEKLKASPEKRALALELLAGELEFLVLQLREIARPTEDQIVRVTSTLRELGALAQTSLTDQVMIFADTPGPQSRPK